MTHPYSTLPDSSFWRRAVAGTSAENVDPVVEAKFVISHHDRIATAGSCFAQHLARRLELAGFNYLVTEDVPIGIDRSLARDFGYRVFSARFGNLYVPRQLLQLLGRSYGTYVPMDDRWSGGGGSIVDPFRPSIQPGGFRSVEEFVFFRNLHFEAVRKMVETMSVFVFTLGLTECWANARDGSVYPVCPGTAGGGFDANEHIFLNLDYQEILADLIEAFQFIRSKNSQVKFLVTVSPVPLVATAEKGAHVLSATTYSKSVLRAVCGTIERRFGDVAYFPSYEIINGNFNRGAYFEKDLREVNEAGVDHVMRVFMRHFAAEHSVSPVPDRSEQPPVSAAKRVAQIVCDEEILDQGR